MSAMVTEVTNTNKDMIGKPITLIHTTHKPEKIHLNEQDVRGCLCV